MSQLPLFSPPRFFKDVVFHRHTDRTVGWLELFYDLVYVATLIQIGNFLSDNVSLLGFGQFLVMLTVVWWAWGGETFYQNRFVVDDLWHRFLVFTQIFAVAALGLSVSKAFGDLYIQFTLAYVAIRLILVLMYIRSARTHPESRELSMGYARGFSFGAAVWLGSLLLPAEIHWVGWLVGIAVELGVPLTPKLRRIQAEWAVDVHHISERLGIFTIILLGESFVKILDDSQGQSFTLTAFLFSVVGLTVVYSLWWLYFSDTADNLADFGTGPKAIAWIYGHLPLAAGLVAFGVGSKKLFAETFEHPGDPVYGNYRILYAASVVLYLVALALIDFGLDDDETFARQAFEAVTHLICAVIIGLVGWFVVGVTATQFVAIIAVVMVVQVVISIVVSNRHATTLETTSH
jgi:low temperature requirement protein LtrA